MGFKGWKMKVRIKLKTLTNELLRKVVVLKVVCTCINCCVPESKQNHQGVYQK